MSKEQTLYLPQKNPDLFQVDPSLVDFSQELKAHFGETSMVMMYGSAAFRQLGYSSEEVHTSKLDCIVAVPDLNLWHQTHAQNHPQDFPMQAHLLGSGLRTSIQGPRSWYVFTELQIPQGNSLRKIKCGIIDQASLANDLTTWDQLYVAGRMQKPTYLAESTPDIENALYFQTMRQGLRMVLLQQNGQTLNSRDLYIKLSNLSYDGDTRMKFAENKSKVSNIVDANLWRFDLMYKQLIIEAQQEGLLNLQDDTIIPITFADDKDLFIKTVEQLPQNLLMSLPPNWQELPVIDVSTLLAERLRQIVKESSIKQTLLGFLTVSPIAGINYVAKKLQKARKNITPDHT